MSFHKLATGSNWLLAVALLSPAMVRAEPQVLRPDAPQAAGALADFGYAVAAGTDWMMVGAPSEDANAGAVYVFDCRSGTCLQSQRLTALVPEDRELFGAALALDSETLAVGSPGKGNGSVSIFVRSGDAWGLQATLVPGQSETDDHFGIALALNGDELIVGADQSGNDGRVFSFSRIATNWAELQAIDPPHLGDRQRFGASVAFAGSRLLVGAPHFDTDGAGDGYLQGQVEVFSQPVSLWQAEQVLTATLPGSADMFGASIAADAARIAVGVPGADGDIGRVDVFETISLPGLSGSVLPPENHGGRFGMQVALDIDRLLTSAPLSAAVNTAGCQPMFLFVNSGSAWEPRRLDTPVAEDRSFDGWAGALFPDGVAYGRPGDRIPAKQGFGSVVRLSTANFVGLDGFESAAGPCPL